jgi:hypothetical protein
MTGSSLTYLLAFALLGMAVLSEGAESMRPFPNRQDGVFVARNFRFRTGDVLPELKLG